MESKMCCGLATLVTWAVVVTSTALTSGCGPSDEEIQQAEDACIALCQNARTRGEDLSLGPCLSESLPDGIVIDDWVCDVAHNPRQVIDDIPTNQCPTYHRGDADHVVEVDPTCSLILAD
jgi:hypothetical protein